MLPVYSYCIPYSTDQSLSSSYKNKMTFRECHLKPVLFAFHLISETECDLFYKRRFWRMHALLNLTCVNIVNVTRVPTKTLVALQCNLFTFNPSEWNDFCTAPLTYLYIC